MVLSLHRT